MTVVVADHVSGLCLSYTVSKYIDIWAMLGNNCSQVRKMASGEHRGTQFSQAHCQGWRQRYASNPVRTSLLSYVFADVLNTSRPSQNTYATRRWFAEAPNVRKLATLL